MCVFLVGLSHQQSSGSMAFCRPVPTSSWSITSHVNQTIGLTCASDEGPEMLTSGQWAKGDDP